jgi:hypothetical protein
MHLSTNAGGEMGRVDGEGRGSEEGVKGEDGGRGRWRKGKMEGGDKESIL